MICPNCKAELHNGDTFCHSCGHKLPKKDAKEQSQSSGEENAQAGREDTPEAKALSLLTRIRRSNFVTRVVNILIMPGVEWRRIAERKPRIGFMIFGYLILLGLIVSPALYFGYILDLLRSDINYTKMYLLLWYSGIRVSGLILFPVIAAIIINALRSSFGVGGSFGRTLQLTAYSATPVFISWALFLLPFPIFNGVLMHVVSLYAIVLLVTGYRKVLSVPDHKRIGFLFSVLGIFYGTYYFIFFMVQFFYPLFWKAGGPDPMFIHF